MAKQDEKGITVKKSEDMPEWYSQVIIKSELADYSSIKGCMVLRPYGYAVWQKIVDYFNERLKELNVKNAYFPMLIPEDFFRKEQEHAKGFAPEVAWIENKDEDKARYALRPTSETIMYDSYSRWIRSWRDLPLRINQWCNIVRWEVKDVKPFLRSREFLWQEGHCVYETEEECDKEARLMLEEYKELAEKLLAIPTIDGIKTEKEKFAGAKTTYTYEAFMPDGKALQMGTSHNLGQGFARAFKIKYIGKDKKEHHPWQNSWGISWRLIGAAVMLHSDDKGLVLPPNIAPIQIVIVPIFFDKDKNKIINEAKKIKQSLKEYSVEVDERDEYTPGWKYNEWEMKGVPLRIEIGPRDIAKKQVVLARRDTGKKEFVKIKELDKKIKKILDDVQDSLLSKAKKLLKDSIVVVKNFKELENAVNNKKMAKALFCGEIECEDWIKDKTKGVTSRCIPFKQENVSGKCVYCGKKANYLVYFARNY